MFDASKETDSLSENLGAMGIWVASVARLSFLGPRLFVPASGRRCGLTIGCERG